MIVSRSSPFFSSVSNARSSSSLHCADVMARVRLRVLLILSAFIQVRIAGLLPSREAPVSTWKPWPHSSDTQEDGVRVV